MLSKFAAHFQMPTENGAEGTETVKASKMKWVKLINPDTLTENPFRTTQRVLARLYIQKGDVKGDAYEQTFYRRGAAGAEEYFEMLKPRYLKLKALGILDVLGPNEPQTSCKYKDNPTIYSSNWYTITLFEKRWAELMGGIAMRPWIFSFSSGTPELEVLTLMLPAFYMVLKYGGGLESHEYSAPSLMDGDGWRTLRIKRILAQLETLGFPIRELSVIVGECGIDGGCLDWTKLPYVSKKPRLGWKDWCYWTYVGEDCMGLPSPQGGMTEELYFRQMSWMDDQYCEIPQVLAHMWFTTNPNDDWPSFDINGDMLKRMAAKYEEVPETPPVPSLGVLEEFLGDDIQKYILPLNPDAALAKAGRVRDLVPASDEVYAMYFDTGYVVQAFRSSDNPDVQYIAYCLDGQYNNIRWFERSN